MTVRDLLAELINEDSLDATVMIQVNLTEGTSCNLEVEDVIKSSYRHRESFLSVSTDWSTLERWLKPEDPLVDEA